jgi:hypothetical protein
MQGSEILTLCCMYTNSSVYTTCVFGSFLQSWFSLVSYMYCILALSSCQFNSHCPVLFYFIFFYFPFLPFVSFTLFNNII